MERRLVASIAVAVLLLFAGCAGLGDLVDDLDGEFDPAADGVEGADHQVTVVGVIDGDTVEVQYPNGTVETARLIGVDTPETRAAEDPAEYGVADTTAGRECLRSAGHDATRFTTQRLLGEQVGISFDPNEGTRGYYGRLLVYVVTENGTHNYDLVETGHARVYESNFAERDRFEDAAADARAENLGLWRCAADEDIPTATATVTDGGTPENGPIRIVDVTADPDGRDGENLNGETVTIENSGEESVSLDGWQLRDEADHTYTFSNLTLAPGGRVTVHTGSGENTASDRYWGSNSPIWNNDGDTARLYRADGTLVAEHSY